MLGLRGARTQLVGEARWQARPINLRDLHGLQMRALRTAETGRRLDLRVLEPIRGRT